MTVLGSTTKQMITAPKNAIYIWEDDYPNYARELAKHLKREDLVVIPAKALRDAAIKDLRDTSEPIVIDHALRFDPEMSRNIEALKSPDRIITQEVREPDRQYPAPISADVIAWTTSQGTGLIIRDENFQVICRMKCHAPMSGGDPTRMKDKFLAIMQQMADLINIKNSKTEASDAAPSQEATEEPDRDAALRLIMSVLADPKTPKALKKKVSDNLAPLL